MMVNGSVDFKPPKIIFISPPEKIRILWDNIIENAARNSKTPTCRHCHRNSVKNKMHMCHTHVKKRDKIFFAGKQRSKCNLFPSPADTSRAAYDGGSDRRVVWYQLGSRVNYSCFMITFWRYLNYLWTEDKRMMPVFDDAFPRIQLFRLIDEAMYSTSLYEKWP